MTPVNQKVSDEKLKQTLTDNPGMSSYKLGILLGVHESSIRARKKSLIKKGWSPPHGWTVEVPEGYHVKGISSLHDANGNIVQQWVKSNIDAEAKIDQFKESIQAFIEELPQLEPTNISTNYCAEDLLAVYPLGDPHIGMLSVAKETKENWNLKIAEKTFINIFDRIVKTAPSCKKALIINLGDFFHRDNAAGITTRSHNVLDCDGKYFDMVQIGMKIIKRMISSALEHHEEVEVWNMIGNHDDVSSIFLAIALKHIYENDPRVIINDNPGLFQYKRFGKNLIGSHHGHTCKMEKLPGVMAADQYKNWGKTEFRYWLTGHIHKDSKYMDEHNGCMVESFKTLAARDAYAYNGGWRSGRNQKVIVYHKDHGEIERHTVNLSYLQKGQ